MSEEELLSLLALKEADGIGGVLCRNILSHLGSAKAFFDAPKAKLLKIPGFGEGIYNSFGSKHTLLEKAERHLALIKKYEVRLHVYSQDSYPHRMKNIYDAPPILFSKGAADINNPIAVGIVGTRKATNYGKGLTEDIVAGLKYLNANIVSGLAYGIDITAHKAALENEMPTTAVMAGGLGMIYPASHKKYEKPIMEQGLMVSENHYENIPVGAQFVARNRIIAGLSDVTIVVESAARGGGLITAEYANNYHREVFAVPGRVGDLWSEGPNNLIKNHKANIFTSVTQLIEQVSWNLDKHKPIGLEKESFDISKLTNDEAVVVTLLREKGAYPIDEISIESHIPLNKLASLLLNLEFADLVRALPGKKFELK